MKLNSGQALVEGLISICILLFLSAGVIEIARLWAFKAILKAAAQEVANQLAHNSLIMLRDGILSFEGTRSDITEKYESEIQTQIEKFVGQLPSINPQFSKNQGEATTIPIRTYIFADVDEIPLAHNEKDLNIRGYSVEINACFSLFFGKKLSSENSFTAGSLKGQRDCLGEFRLSEKSFSFKVHVMAYSPTPASFQIFKYGFPEPNEMHGISPLIPDVLGAEQNLNHNSFQRMTEFFINKRAPPSFFREKGARK